MQDGQIRHPDNLHTTATTETSVEQAKQKPISQEDIVAARVKLESMKTQDGAKTSNAVDISHARHTSEVADHQGFHNPAAEVFNHSLETGASHPHHTGLPLASDNPAISRSFSGAVSAELRAENQHGLLSLKAPLPGEKSTAPKEEAPLPKLSENRELPVPKFSGNIESHPAFRAKEEVDLKGKPEGTYQITRGSDEHGGYRLKIVVPDPNNPGKTIVKTMMLEKNDADGMFQLKRVLAGEEKPIGKGGSDLNQVIKETVCTRYGADPQKIDSYNKALFTHEPPITKQTGKELLGVLSQTWTGQTDKAKQQAGEQLCKRLEGLKSATNEQLMEMREDLSNLSNTMSALNELGSPHKETYDKALTTLKTLENKSSGLEKASNVVNEIVASEKTRIKNMKNCVAVLTKFQNEFPEKDRPFVDAYIKKYAEVALKGTQVCNQLEQATAELRKVPPNYNKVEEAMQNLKSIYEKEGGDGQELLKGYAELSLMHERIGEVFSQIKPKTNPPVTIKQFINSEKNKIASLRGALSDPEIMPVQRLAQYNLFMKDLAKAASEKMGDQDLANDMETMGASIENIVTPIDVNLAFDEMGKLSGQIKDLEAKLKKKPNDVKLNAEMQTLMDKMQETISKCLKDQRKQLGKNEHKIIGEQLQNVVNYQKASLAKKENQLVSAIPRLQKKPSEQLVRSSINEINNLKKQNEIDRKTSLELDAPLRDLCLDNIKTRDALIKKLIGPTDAAAIKIIQDKSIKFASSKPDAAALDNSLNETLKGLAEVNQQLTTEPNNKKLLDKKQNLMAKASEIMAKVNNFSEEINADSKELEGLASLPQAEKLQQKLIADKNTVLNGLKKVIGEKEPDVGQQAALDTLRNNVNKNLTSYLSAVDKINKLQVSGRVEELNSNQKKQLKLEEKNRDNALRNLEDIRAELNQAKQIFKLSNKEKTEIDELNNVLNSPKKEEKARELSELRAFVEVASLPLKPMAYNFLDLNPKKQKIAELKATLARENPEELKRIEEGTRVIVRNRFGEMEVRDAQGFDLTNSKTMFTQMENQEKVYSENMKLLKDNIALLEAKKPQLNDHQKEFLQHLKDIATNDNPAEKAQEWVVKNRSVTEDEQAVPTGYNTAFTADSKPTFYSACETSQLMLGHQILAEKDPANKKAYDDMSKLIDDLKEASDAARPDLKSQYEDDINAGKKVIKQKDLSLDPKAYEAIENLRDKIHILEQRLEKVKFEPTKYSKVGELSKLKYHEALKSLSNQLGALQRAMDAESKKRTQVQKKAA